MSRYLDFFVKGTIFMSEMQFTHCPGCGQHCDLTAPSCPRGEAFAKTGAMPPREEKGLREEGRHGGSPEHSHGPHGPMHGRGHDGRPHRGPHPLEDDSNYTQLSEDEKILSQLRRLGFISRFGAEGKGGQERVIRTLARHGAMTQRELTEKLGIQPGSASEIIGKAERAGLLTRSESEQDRRTVDVALTEEGRQLAGKESLPPLQCFTEEEKHQLLSMLEKLSAAWREN